MTSKVEQFRLYALRNLNKWICSVCASGSNQPAAIFREVKALGYVFEEPAPNRWATSRFCATCGELRSHYRLTSATPEFSVRQRIAISNDQRRRILTLLDRRDAFTGASISSTPEIDHKVPWTRLTEDIDAAALSDSEIREHFQLLTREHNALKDKNCASCKISDIRPPFFGISYWYSGGSEYAGSCEGCGWHDGARWRESVNAELGDSGK